MQSPTTCLTQLDSEPAIATFVGDTETPEALSLNSALHNSTIKNLIATGADETDSTAAQLATQVQERQTLGSRFRLT